MHGVRTWSQVRRDQKAEKRQKDREERHRAADSRHAQSYQQCSEQQTIHDSLYHVNPRGSIHDSHTETREIYDRGRRGTVTTTTETITITSPNGYSLPYRKPRPGPQPTSAYTGEKLDSQTDYTERRQPLGEGHRDTHGYQSTSSQQTAKPRPPSQQPSTPHQERGRRPRRSETASSVVNPTSISEPETVVAAPKGLRPRDVVTMLPTPPASVSTKAPPSSTKHTRDPSRHRQPLTYGYKTERRPSPHLRGNLATQSSGRGHSVRPASGGAQREPTQSKRSTVTTKPKIGSTGKTQETRHTTEPGRTRDRTQTAQPPTPAPRRRRRGLGEPYGYDPRD